MSEIKKYPFLRSDELRTGNQITDRVRAWQEHAIKYESHAEHGYEYPAARVESLGDGEQKLERYHGESFVSWIERRLASDPETKKLAILDIGGGAGLYAEQLRKKFGDQVQVFTTGLDKKSANTLRKYINEKNDFFSFKYSDQVEDKIHPDDLKWRSVLQLSDFPEFDLMVDTIGELSYLGESESETKRYLSAVIHKLKIGGHASMVIGSELERQEAVLALEELQQDPTYQSTFTFNILSTDLPTGTKNGEMFLVLKIDKTHDLHV